MITVVIGKIIHGVEVDGEMIMGLSIYGVAVMGGSLYSRFYGIPCKYFLNSTLLPKCLYISNLTLVLSPSSNFLLH